MKIKRGEYLYPKGNAFFERFNRSLQEDFVDYREELKDDLGHILTLDKCERID